jgi:phosphotransferase system HPr (HPr) family protein
MHTNSETVAGAAEVTVLLPANLHARPAGRLAQAAARFESTVTLEHAGRTANPTGILAVMALGATAGTTVTIRAEGPDAEPAVRELAQVLSEAE